MKDFEREKERFERFLKEHAVWAVATGAQNDISVRSMSIINRRLKIYFQTDILFEKYKHLMNNPCIALCCANYQVKGLAEVLGPTMDETNAELMSYFKEVHPDSYRQYSRRQNSCLVEVEPESVQIWDYVNGEPYITRMNLVEKSVESTKYI